jgi:hypothetical protein
MHATQSPAQLIQRFFLAKFVAVALLKVGRLLVELPKMLGRLPVSFLDGNWRRIAQRLKVRRYSISIHFNYPVSLLKFRIKSEKLIVTFTSL